MATGQPKDWVADETKVSLIADALRSALQHILEDNKEVNVSVNDVFMGVHNFHKRVVRDVAAQFAANGTNPNTIYRTADSTWRKAMRDLRL